MSPRGGVQRQPTPTARGGAQDPETGWRLFRLAAGGGGVLCGPPDTVRPLGVAPVRPHGYGVSRHCGAPICGLNPRESLPGPWDLCTRGASGVADVLPVSR